MIQSDRLTRTGRRVAISFAACLAIGGACASSAQSASVLSLEGSGDDKTITIRWVSGGSQCPLNYSIIPNGGMYDVQDRPTANPLCSYIWDGDGLGTGCEGYLDTFTRAFCPTEGVKRVIVIGGPLDDSASAATMPIPLIGDGRDGNDHLLGTLKEDQLIGGPGNDVLEGEGSGISCAPPCTPDDILVGGSGSDTIDGGLGANNLLSYADHLEPIGVNLFASHIAGGPEDDDPALPGAQRDTIMNVQDLYGGSASDNLFGDNAANKLDGGPGNDLLLGLGGDDVMYGNDGDDTLFDELWGVGGGNDTLDGGQGIDQLYGQTGQDTLYARDPIPGAWVYWPDTVDCGDGDQDKARANPAPLVFPDTVVGCEELLP